MKILIINAGSSSLKYQFMESEGGEVFAKGLCEGLGVTDVVSSPTYTLVNEYLSGRMPLFRPTSSSTSAGRTIWPGAASAPWSGARMWPTP